MRNKLLFFLIALLTLPATIQAEVEVGLGSSSFTSGRMIPALNLSYDSSDYVFSFMSTGTASKLYYFSGYTFGMYSSKEIGQVFGSPVTGGLGAGGFYSKMGYRETVDDDLEEASDAGLGPGFRLSWVFFDPFYMSIEGIFGVTTIPLYLLYLSTQDIVVFSIGLRF